ncbi:extracellular solute-binding protein [Limobrevibacterium gyesilva]|uniref:Extracellular solute-binding protein n=1 Tax=Limobrevibacterium gyesilva TaxID=2991712 RepID=A0AA41YMF2_9PROT|nr:extracellular solute-binding protein [Limobrevibacterium gyesilva]MCW3475012.1 extracellular solute-binding protein [Limobrevibacterium gyesilva]
MTEDNNFRLSRRGFAKGTLATGFTLAAPAVLRAQNVIEIEYWQYFFKERVEAIDALIAKFEAANPGIKVKHTHFPYAQYRTKVAAAVPAGEGPAILQLFFGWMREYAKAKLIQPLPSELFKTAEIDDAFFDFVKLMKTDGTYWAIPTAVRSLGLFYNKKLLADAGVPGGKPPATLDEMLKDALAVTQRDSRGNITTAGATIGLPSQDHHWWREVLVRQFGGRPYSDDFRTVMYGSDAGGAAFAWYTDLQRKHKVAAAGFLSESQAAFKAGKAGVHVDGSFRLGTFKSARGLDWGVAELPQHNGVKSNYASYWVNGLSSTVAGAKRDAAAKFLAFITTNEAMQLWFDTTGELPARKSVALSDKNLADPLAGPMLAGLRYAHATDFVNEDAQGQIFADMLDRVLIQNQDPTASVKQAAAAEQQLIDNYYKT